MRFIIVFLFISDICDRNNLGLSEVDMSKLMTKYDLKNNNSFSYTEFLKHFVLNMKQQPDVESAGPRKKLLSTRPSVSIDLV